MTRPYTAPAIRRAAQALEVLAQSSSPVRLTAIAQRLDCGKSSALGLLRTLEEVGWVEKDASGAGFRLGEGLWNLTHRGFAGREVAEVARPLLQRVAEQTGESAFLGLPREGRVVIEYCVEGGHELGIAARPGGALPRFAGATAKVLLADQEPAALRAALVHTALPAFTERTLTDPEAFLAEVDRTRQQGYGTDDEEYLRGVRAVAVPVRTHGELAAVLWVAGFASRLTETRLNRVREELLQAASLVAALLGG